MFLPERAPCSQCVNMYQRSRRCRVIASTDAFDPGPITSTVLDPAATWVRPASATVKVGRPALSALLRSSFLSSIPNLLLRHHIVLDEEHKVPGI
jgi:hypothetical protein